jgi:SlyX protein
MSEARLTELETRLAFQDDVIQGLNLGLADQQRRIAALAAEVAELRRQLRALAPAEADPEHQAPPHY